MRIFVNSEDEHHHKLISEVMDHYGIEVEHDTRKSGLLPVLDDLSEHMTSGKKRLKFSWRLHNTQGDEFHKEKKVLNNKPLDNRYKKELKDFILYTLGED